MPKCYTCDGTEHLFQFDINRWRCASCFYSKVELLESHLKDQITFLREAGRALTSMWDLSKIGCWSTHNDAAIKELCGKVHSQADRLEILVVKSK